MTLQDIIEKLNDYNYYDIQLIDSYNKYNNKYYKKIIIEANCESYCLKLLEILGLKTYNQRIKNHNDTFYSITAIILND